MEKKDFISDKLHYILFAIVIIIAAAVRIWGLGDKSLWVDEVYTFIFCSQKTFLSSFSLMIYDLSPPIYYLILFFWIKLFGNTEFIIRLPGFFAGMASIFAVYLFIKKNFDKQIALGAVVLTGLSPVLLYYSQEARPYSFFVLFSVLTLLAWIEIIKKIKNNENDTINYIKYAVFSLLTIFTHYWGLIFIFFQILYLFIYCLVKKIETKPLVILSINVFLISGAFIIFQYSFLNKFALVLNGLVPKVFISSSLVQIFNQIFYYNYWFLLIILLFLLFNIKTVKKFLISELAENKLASPLIYLSYIIILPVFAYMLVDKISSYAHPRHLLFIVPAAYILISYIINSLVENKKLIKNIFIFALSLTFLGIYLFVPQNVDNRKFVYYEKPKQEWKESTKYILETADDNSVIVIDRVKLFYKYYFEKYNKNINNLNIVVDKKLFSDRKKSVSQKIKNLRKKYKKVYIYSTAMLEVEKIDNLVKTAKPYCPHLERKNFVSINLYECY